MKSPNIKILMRIVGMVLAVLATLSVLFTLALIFGARNKDYSVIQSVGAWPAFSLFLVLVSVYFIAGAPHLVRALQKGRTNQDTLKANEN